MAGAFVRMDVREVAVYTAAVCACAACSARHLLVPGTHTHPDGSLSLQPVWRYILMKSRGYPNSSSQTQVIEPGNQEARVRNVSISMRWVDRTPWLLPRHDR